MSLKRIIIALLALPVAELVLFIIVAAEIGLLRAIGLQLAISVFGYLLLRRAGSGRLSRLRAEVAAHGAFVRSIRGAKGAMMLAGILLLIPGFITDVLGAALLVPPLRRRLAMLARGALEPRQAGGGRPDPVIDLAPDEWRDITKPGPKKKRSTPRRR